MSINSEKTFKRVMIENNFEFSENDGFPLLYGFDIIKDSIEGDKSSLWGSYSELNGEFSFQFFDNDLEWLISLLDETDENLYNSIVGKIKRNCKYYDIVEEDGDDYVCYSCSQSKYKGKIGFRKFDDSGVIRHILPKKQITYNDIMSINSEQTFNKVMIDNGYDLIENKGDTIGFGIEYKNSVNGGVWTEWGFYEKVNGEFEIGYEIIDENNNPYNLLVNDIKGKCKFYNSIGKYLGYDCSESTYSGKIGVSITDTMGYIKHIIPTEE